MESIANIVAAGAARCGRLDILVNNTGCNVREPALDVAWEDWSLILGTHLRGQLLRRREAGSPSSATLGLG